MERSILFSRRVDKDYAQIFTRDKSELFHSYYISTLERFLYLNSILRAIRVHSRLNPPGPGQCHPSCSLPQLPPLCHSKIQTCKIRYEAYNYLLGRHH
jgi:hypothetical protein